MIKLIVGSKGSGKTKVLIDLVNKAAETSSGSVVCIEKAMNLNFSIKPSVRLIHADEYEISGYEQFYGFITGVLAGNYDITDIFVDGILRIGNRDLDALATMVANVEKIVKDDVSVTFTVSTAAENLPESLKAYL
ncbi:MAG: ATP-binding protein [Clostridiales bacterium]|nr:ATP-binding protein [Clostridiales bacterium]